MSESFAGPLMKQEIEAIDKIFKNKKNLLHVLLVAQKYLLK